MGPVAAAEALLDSLVPQPARPHAASMRQVAKVSYTHADMIDAIIAEPSISQGELAARYGYTPAWICQVIASDAFQAQLAARKDELIDPVLRMTIEERFRALVRRSLDVLQEKLAQPHTAIPDQLALRAAELGARSLGLGHQQPPPPPPAGDRLVILSDRLVGLLSSHRERTVHGEATRVSSEDAPAALSAPEAGG